MEMETRRRCHPGPPPSSRRYRPRLWTSAGFVHALLHPLDLKEALNLGRTRAPRGQISVVTGAFETVCRVECFFNSCCGTRIGLSLHLGFSEYGAYASWVAAHHPETVQLAPRRLWSRHPMGPLIGSLGIALQQAWGVHSPHGHMSRHLHSSASSLSPPMSDRHTTCMTVYNT